jgi:hypothetical protein
MAVNKGVIIFRGDAGRPQNHYSKSTIEYPTDDTTLATFCTSFAAHTEANIARRSFNTVTQMTDSAPGTGVNMDNRCVLYMRDPATMHIVSFEYPAPVAADWITVAEGDRLTSVALNAIVADINTMTGKSYSGLYGKVIKTA